MKAGRLTSETLIRSCLERIEARDPVVKAWLHVDPELAIRQARERDKRPSIGPLHGLPFGVKDIMDTADMPTTYNSPAWQGHRPTRDAACVGIVRHAGAVILGKTDTVEFAFNSRKAASSPTPITANTPPAARPRARARRSAISRSPSPLARRRRARISARPPSTASMRSSPVGARSAAKACT